MKDLLGALFAGRSLGRDEARAAMRRLIDGEPAPEQTAALLGALRSRKETLDELVGFALALRERAVVVPVTRRDLVDGCGTGGDGAGTFNISTAAALVLAGAGVGVAKHGNRSVSSRCGSADVLEALGVRVDLTPDEAGAAIDRVGFAFLLAPRYHPALAAVAAVRRALGVPTVFNLLGPLVNPARVRRQVVGVYDTALVETMARALGALGAEEAMVVSAEHGLDELSVCGPTRVAHLREGAVRTLSVAPEDVGLARAELAALAGGDAARNAAIIERVLDGERGAPRDVVLLNAAAGLVVAGLALALRDGVRLAAEVIDTGRARLVLESLRRGA